MPFRIDWQCSKFFCPRVCLCQKIHYKQHRSKMFLHSLFTLCEAKHLLEQGCGVSVNRLCRSDGRVCSVTVIIRREWRLQEVKQTTFVCLPTQSLSKWPLLGFDCNRIPTPPFSTPLVVSDSSANAVTVRYGIRRREGQKFSDQSPPMLRRFAADGPFQA